MIQKESFKRHYGDLDQEDFRIFFYSDADMVSLHPHQHNYFEMYVLIQGNIIYRTGPSKFYLKANDMLFINRDQVHRPTLVDNKIPYERIVLHVSPKTLQTLSTDDIDLATCFTSNNFTVYHYPEEVRNRIMANLYDLFDLFQPEGQADYGQRLMARASLTKLFVEINKANLSSQVFSFDASSKERQTVAVIRQFVLDNLAENISIDDVANYLYKSRFHLMRSFKKWTGETLYQFILKTKLTEAKKLLAAGHPANSVSALCGFNDYSSFYRAYRKFYHTSPGDHL